MKGQMFVSWPLRIEPCVTCAQEGQKLVRWLDARCCLCYGLLSNSTLDNQALATTRTTRLPCTSSTPWEQGSDHASTMGSLRIKRKIGTYFTYFRAFTFIIVPNI